MEIRSVVAVLLAVASVGQDCAKYTCETPLAEVNPDTCAWFNSTAAVWYLQPCSNGQVCSLLDSTGENSTCFTLPTAAPPANPPGFPCEDNSACVIFNSTGLGCNAKICLGKEQGGTCAFPVECNPGLTCIDSVCQLQRGKREACDSDLDCRNDYGCDQLSGGQQGTCVPYFSLSEGDAVESCPGPQLPTVSPLPYINLLCKSASCAVDPISGTASCIEAPVSAGKLPTQCQSRSNCTADEQPEGEVLTTECGDCGFNIDGTRYCGLFPGESYFKDLLEKTKSWLGSSDLSKCNTMHRWDCMSTVWGKKAEEWQFYFQATTLYAQVAGAEDCVVGVLFPEYSEANRDSSHRAALGLLAVFIVSN